MTFTADKIRNILLAGHGGSGKTALAEAMLFKSGATERMGNTNEGSTVSDFDPEEIRRKTQIYEPDVLVIMDDTLVGLPQTYAGLKDGGTVLINSTKPLSELGVPDCAGVVAEVDATGISERLFGQNLPNTAVLGAFTKVVGIVDRERLFAEIEATFGAENRRAAELAYESVSYLKGGEAGV